MTDETRGAQSPRVPTVRLDWSQASRQPTSDQSPTFGGPPRARLRKQRSRRVWPRLLRRTLLGLLLVGIAVAAWLGVRGLQAYRHLSAARTDVAQLKASVEQQRFDDAQQSLDRLRTEAAAAHRETGDVIWRVVGAVPLLGAPVHSTTVIARGVDELSTASLPALVDAGRRLVPRGSASGGLVVDVVALRRSAPTVDAAARATAAVSQTVAALSGSTWLSPVDAARASFLGQLKSLTPLARSASIAADAGPGLLGADGPRNYFVAFQTNAELRGTGGLVGAYAIMHADAGRLSFPTVSSDADLHPAAAPVIDLGPDYDALYARDAPYQFWGDTNESPNFPYAARIWMALYQKQTGQRLDGAMATDPVALGRLLAATGPVRLPSGQVVTAHNVVALTEQATYAQANSKARKTSLVDVAKVVTTKIEHLRAAQGSAALAAFQDDVGLGRLFLYSAHQAEQSRLLDSPISGVLPDSAQPTAVAVLNNGGANKLDYYLRSTLAYSAGGCNSRQRNATVTLTVTNRAPTSGLPQIVTQRLDTNKPHPVGQQKLIASYYATRGAAVMAAELNGRPAGVGFHTELGHPVFTTYLYVDPGQTVTWSMQLQEPASAGPVFTRPQAMATPQQVVVTAPVCR